MKKALAFAMSLVLLLSFTGCCFSFDGIKGLAGKKELAADEQDVQLEEPTTDYTEEPATAVPTEPEPEPTVPPTTAPVETQPPKLNKVPYLLDITRLNLPIFDEPSYDGRVVDVVYKQGVYTITQEKVEDGTRWGKLKSGLGWIDLDEAVRSVSAAVSYTHNSLTSRYPVVDRVYLGGTLDVYLFVNKKVTDFEIVTVEDCWTSPHVSSVEAEVGRVNPGEAVMLTFNIYGDAQSTNVGIRFTDSSGIERVFFITDNGRNNMLSLVEA